MANPKPSTTHDASESSVSRDTPLPRFALPEVVGVALSADDLANIVQESVEEMARALECSRLIVLSYVPKERLLRGVTVVGAKEDNVRLWKWPIGEFAAAKRAIETGEIVPLAASVALPSEFASLLPGSRAVIPLRLKDRPLAVLVGLLQRGVSARSASWRKRAEEVAERASLVVELERVASAYQDERRLRASTREIAASILEGRPLAEIAATLTGLVSDRLREDRVALFLKDEVGNVRPIHLLNVSAEYGEAVSRVANRSQLVARAVATGLPYYGRDVQNDTQLSGELRNLFRQENICSVLIASLQYRDQMKGALVIYPRDEREFTPAEMNVVQAFADMATLGVAISQLLEEQRDIAMMDERNRLAREMHDTVAQSLTGLLMQIETARDLIAASDQNGAQELLSNAYLQAKKALEDTRRAVQGLTPALLDGLSPLQAIRAETERFQQETGVVSQFLSSGEEQPLTPDQQTALLRIAQEALTNARKHASPSRVRVGLQYASEDVALLIEDDGVGFDTSLPTSPDSEKGFGLFGMNERVRLLGGDLKVESTPGWGTRVQARLPYRPSSPVPAWASVAERPKTQSNVASANTSNDSQPSPSLVSSNMIDESRILRVLIADDHAVTRQGLKTMLEASGEVIVVGEAEDGAQAAEMSQSLHPDVVLMDIQMPRTDGIEGLRRIQNSLPDLPVVILTTLPSDKVVLDALNLGAKGFWLKDADAFDILSAVRTASRGQTTLAPAITQLVTSFAAGRGRPSEDLSLDLNEREREVLEALARGARNKDIASQLFITPKTVEYHLTNLFLKLGVSNRTEAVRAAIERRLINPVQMK